MKSFIKLIFSLTIFIFFSLSSAQNMNRIDEEQTLDQLKKQQIEEFIRQRELEEERIKKNPELYANPEKQNLVEVEPSNILPSDLSTRSALVPYKIRRKKYGAEVGLGYNMFAPVNYESDYASSTLINFEDLYGTAPLYEVYGSFKKHFSFGSVGVEAGYGFYKNDVDDTSFGENLSITLQTLRLGARILLDALRYEPYVAPYFSAGGHTVFFSEKNGQNSFNGNTQVAPYYTLGALIQLNWVDKSAAVEAYTEGGIENTFLFIEMKQFLASNAEADPDFSTNPFFAAGLSLEF